MNSKNINGNFLNGGNFVKPSTYKHQAYNLIKDAILFRRLKIGSVYSQDTLCNELGISRTPVREALLELQKEGYVKFLRGRGVLILPVTVKQAEEITEMRHCIEIEGSRLAALRRTKEQLANLKKTHEKMKRGISKASPQSMYRLDREFHRGIFQAADNKYMFQTIEKLRDHFLRFETQTAFDTEDGAKQVCEEHLKILKALERGDEEEAVDAMKGHMYHTYYRTVKPSFKTNESETVAEEKEG